MPGHLFEGHPVSEGTTRRGTDTPVHHPDALSTSLSLDKSLSFQQSLPHGHLPCVVTQGPSLKGPTLGLMLWAAMQKFSVIWSLKLCFVGVWMWFGAFPGAFGLGRAQHQRRGTSP